MSTTETSPTRDAFELLSKPTLELTDAEVTAVCKDLRARRERFLAGQKDNQPKAKKPTSPVTAEEKKAVTDNLLSQLEDGNLF